MQAPASSLAPASPATGAVTAVSGTVSGSANVSVVNTLPVLINNGPLTITSSETIGAIQGTGTITINDGVTLTIAVWQRA